jgi:hypothetical protein
MDGPSWLRLIGVSVLISSFPVFFRVFMTNRYGDDFNRSPEREMEMNNLRNAEVGELLRRYSCTLISWKEV